jgi:hypothetical protein
MKGVTFKTNDERTRILHINATRMRQNKVNFNINIHILPHHQSQSVFRQNLYPLMLRTENSNRNIIMKNILVDNRV